MITYLPEQDRQERDDVGYIPCEQYLDGVTDHRIYFIEHGLRRCDGFAGLEEALEAREDCWPTGGDCLQEFGFVPVEGVDDGEFDGLAEGLKLDDATGDAFCVEFGGELMVPGDDDAAGWVVLDDLTSVGGAAVWELEGPGGSGFPGGVVGDSTPVCRGELGLGEGGEEFLSGCADVDGVDELLAGGGGGDGGGEAALASLVIGLLLRMIRGPA